MAESGLSWGIGDLSLRHPGSSLRRPGSSLRHASSLLQHVGFSLVVLRGLVCSCGAQAPEHAGSVVAARGLSSCGVQAPEHVGSVVAAHGLCNCGAQAYLPCGMWDLSSPARD